ncbi:MATE family efflux transporter [Paenibacillus senegalensis]|uniref:MATE family efflux transporter n=1 Tax=Paenibacillus senegalensis TaxID=1465766 RepID=UPI00030100E1|nr:MATE family efflux transporter [Paenibacillus senegalensis]
MIGFPSFLAEVGISVFTVSHNIILERLEGTDGVAAFAVINYTHSLILMTFLGLGAAVQPLISYYYGSQSFANIRLTMRIAVRTALIAGGLLFTIVQLGASQVVQMFGDFPAEVTNHAIYGLRLFVFAYLFMGVNFVMMTFFQTAGYAKMAVGMTAAREMIFMLAFLLTLPLVMGVTGVWLSVPLAEGLVLFGVVYGYRRFDPVGGLAMTAAIRRNE